jgi:hypothetical protein
MYRTLVLTSVLSITFTAGVLAQTPYGEEGKICRHDAVHFCKGISEEFRVRDCLVAQKHRISGRCRKVLESHGY